MWHSFWVFLVQKFLYPRKIKNLVKKQKIKVAFLHMGPTSIQNLGIFEKMLQSERFDPYLIVNPDVLRSKENLIEQCNQSFRELTQKYGENRVLLGYDIENNKANDYTKQFDIAFTNNPYDIMAHKFFTIAYWARKGVPMLYISYFYMGRCFTSIKNLKNIEFNYFWKVFVENEYVISLAKEHQRLKGKNLVLSGYPKLDNLPQIEKKEYTNKRIIIAPHHTIDSNPQSRGGFLQWADTFLLLPKKYRDIHFIFRPHPLLFETLKNFWSKEKIEAYKTELFSNDNVEYSCEGDYLELFKNSDALIHDCGSYMSEYLYTGNPCAYLYKQGANYNNIFVELGFKLLDCHAKIQTQQDLIDFIDNVVIKGEDTLKQHRQTFAKEKIMINYPNTQDVIMNHILESLS